MAAVSNSAQSPDFGTEGSTLFGTISYGTIGSESEQGKDDKVTPIVEQIISREKENQEAVKRIKALLIKDGKKCIKMALSVQTKKKTVENLKKQNETTAREIQYAQNKLLQKETESGKPSMCAETNKDLEPILQSLQQLLNDLTNDVRGKELYLMEKEKQSKEKDGKNQYDSGKLRSPTSKSSEHQRVKDRLADLKAIVQGWLSRLSNLFRSSKGKAENIPNFQTGVQKIVQFIDSSAAMSELGKRKVKKEQLKKLRSEVHQKVTKHLVDRKPLENMSSKIRTEFQRIAQKREMTETIPEQKTNLVVHLVELYEWGCKERERDEYRMAQLERRIKESKEKFQGCEKQRNKNTASKIEELKQAEETLTKLEQQDKELRQKRSVGH